MNIKVLQTRAQTAESLGRDLEKSKEALHKERYKLEGAVTILQKVETDINKVTQVVKEEVMGEGAPINMKDPLQVAKYIVEKLMLVSRGIHEHMERAAAAIPIVEGKQLGLDLAIKNAHNMFKENATVLDAVLADLNSGKAVVNPSGAVESLEEGIESLQGSHPGLSEKAKSMEEDVQESKSIQRRKKIQKGKSVTKKPATKRGKGKKKADAKVT